MVSFKERIDKNIRKTKKKSGILVFEEILFLLSKELNLPITEVINSPTPLIISLVEQVNNHYKKQNKPSKRR